MNETKSKTVVWRAKVFDSVQEMNAWLENYADKINVRWITRTDGVFDSRPFSEWNVVYQFNRIQEG